MQRTLHALAGVMTAALLVVTAGCGGGGASPFVGPPPKVTPSLSNIAFGSSIACSSIPCTTTFTVSEPGYNGTFTAMSSNTNVVTVATTLSSSAQARTAQDTTATFTVTAVSGGTATIVVSDQQNRSTSIPVTVSSLTFTPQLKR